MSRKDLIKKIQDCSPDKIERIKAYLDVLDRALVKALVSKIMSSEEVHHVMDWWQTQIKNEINLESGNLTEFLMETPMGRYISTKTEAEDGETLRLNSLEAMKIAKEIADHNYS